MQPSCAFLPRWLENAANRPFALFFNLTGNESAPIKLAQCRFPGLAISDAKMLIYFQIKYTEAILSKNTRKLLWFEITKMLIAVYEKNIKILFGTLSFPISQYRQYVKLISLRTCVAGSYLSVTVLL